MIRLRLGLAGVGRIRFGFSPLAETVLSLRTLSRGERAPRTVGSSGAAAALKTLAASGIVTARRDGRAVLYQRTRLGEDLLKGHGAGEDLLKGNG